VLAEAEPLIEADGGVVLADAETDAREAGAAVGE
jgi:hypothetical protein